MAADVNIDEITDVTIGSAATFRNTINNNFDILKDEWTGIYVGSNEDEAKAHLKTGGLWIVTSE